MAAGADKVRFEKRYGKLVRPDAPRISPPYRPPPDALPARKPAPEPGESIGERVKAITGEINRQFRGHLERWGGLEDFDRMRAESLRPRPRSPDAPEVFTAGAPPPEPDGLERWRVFDEQQKALQAQYERMGGWG